MIKLNLGCGHYHLEDHINIDMRPVGDLVADVLELPFKPNTVDTITAIDVFEHISFTKSQGLIQHWYDVLKPGGDIFIQAPCLERIIQYLNETGHKTVEGLELTIACLYGAQDYPENYHYTTTIPILMDHYLKTAGFKKIQYRLDNTNANYRAIK